MATLVNRADLLRDKTAYYQVRRAQAAIAGYRHFADGDLARYLQREAFETVASRLTDHFFRRSRGLAIYDQVKELYLAHMILAPILQRLPLSSKYDWHRGHLLGWFRCNANCRTQRFHFATRAVERDYRPELLQVGLETIGIRDGDMVRVLLDLYRRHAGGTTLKDLLAHQLFDPIMAVERREGYELRYANRLFRMERESFADSVDLRKCRATVLDYSIQSVQHRGSRHLEILITEETMAAFRKHVKAILGSAANPERKVVLLEACIRDFVERTRWARSSKEQMKALRSWFCDKLRPLSGTSPQARHVANQLLNRWFQRADHLLYLKKPTFFLNADDVDEQTYTTFFSPYREVMP